MFLNKERELNFVNFCLKYKLWGLIIATEEKQKTMTTHHLINYAYLLHNTKSSN